jgi:hypothetical protein
LLGTWSVSGDCHAEDHLLIGEGLRTLGNISTVVSRI